MAAEIRSLAAGVSLAMVACGTSVSSSPTAGETLDGNDPAWTLGASGSAQTPIEVSVVDHGGAPVAGARVVVGGRYSSEGSCLVGAEKVAEGVTDETGVCRVVARLSSAVAGLRAAACVGDRIGLGAWAERPGTERTALTVSIGAGVRPRGAVVDTHGQPVPGARVESWYGGGNLRVFRGATISGVDGSFRLPPLPRAAADDLFVEAFAPQIGSGGVTPTLDDPLDDVRIVLSYPPPPPAGGHGPK